MSDRPRHQDIGIEITTVTMSNKMTISLPRVRFLDEKAKDTPTPENTAPRPRRSVDR